MQLWLSQKITVVSGCAYLWVPSKLVQSLLCIGGSLLNIYFYFTREVCLVNRVCNVVVYSFRDKPRTLLCIFVLVDPYGRHYELHFRSRNHILDIILHDQLLLFDHSFFHSRKVSINDVTQLCYTTRVCPRPLTLVWKSRHTFIHLELSLVPKVVFIFRGGSIAL